MVKVSHCGVTVCENLDNPSLKECEAIISASRLPVRLTGVLWNFALARVDSIALESSSKFVEFRKDNHGKSGANLDCSK
jgi:hypothetical protein